MIALLFMLIYYMSFVVSESNGYMFFSRSKICQKVKLPLIKKINFRGGSFYDEQDEDIANESDLKQKLIEKTNKIFAFPLDMWNKTPLISRTYIISSIGLTLFFFIFNRNRWSNTLDINWYDTFLKMHLWRPFTSFLYFGPFGINYLLTIHFVWTYMTQLEKLHYNKPHEFLVMLLFGCISLLAGYFFLGISTRFLGHNLSTFLVYIWAKLYEGLDVNMMDIFIIRAELLPWFFCLQSLLLEGEIPFADFLGIGVGHLYYYLKNKKIIQEFTPQILKNFFEQEQIVKLYAPFRNDFE